jgi:hypothetical protein
VRERENVRERDGDLRTCHGRLVRVQKNLLIFVSADGVCIIIIVAVVVIQSRTAQCSEIVMNNRRAWPVSKAP